MAYDPIGTKILMLNGGPRRNSETNEALTSAVKLEAERRSEILRSPTHLASLNVGSGKTGNKKFVCISDFKAPDHRNRMNLAHQRRLEFALMVAGVPIEII